MRVCVSRANYRHKGPPVSGAVKEGRWWFIEVHSLEHLMELATEEDEPLVVYPAKLAYQEEGTPSVVVYDDYLE